MSVAKPVGRRWHGTLGWTGLGMVLTGLALLVVNQWTGAVPAGIFAFVLFAGGILLWWIVIFHLWLLNVGYMFGRVLQKFDRFIGRPRG